LEVNHATLNHWVITYAPLIEKRLRQPMPWVGNCRSSNTARRTICGFADMLWLCNGFRFAGAWTVREQNQRLGVCFGLQTCNETWKRGGSRPCCVLRHDSQQAPT
jgi:hypothetical protein